MWLITAKLRSLFGFEKEERVKVDPNSFLQFGKLVIYFLPFGAILFAIV